LVFNAIMKLAKPASVVERFAHLGLAELLDLTTVTHLRVGEPFFLPVIVGVLVWGGIFLRDSRLRAPIPLRRAPQESPTVRKVPTQIHPLDCERLMKLSYRFPTDARTA
jgi:hypothetical protein